MARTQNGFELAELDLDLRGPGEFFGTKQTGMPDFRVANPLRDRKMLELARQQAQQFVGSPTASLTDAEAKTVMQHLREHWQRRYGLVEA
jgi:ATP-dependent DNA helicase RecG